MRSWPETGMWEITPEKSACRKFLPRTANRSGIAECEFKGIPRRKEGL